MKIKTRTSVTGKGFRALILELCEKELSETSEYEPRYEALLDLMKALLYIDIEIINEEG